MLEAKLMILISLLFLFLFISKINAEEIKITPNTRDELKTVLNNLKYRESRLFFQQKFDLEGNPTVNNRLLKETYLPETWYSSDFKNDPNMTLSYELKTQCFWVVSRANNCHYCLGHQEHKLFNIGFNDNQIAMLDYDWGGLKKSVIKAVGISKKITLRPHELTDEDIKCLYPEFNNEQIIELIYIISMFNNVNRWTDSTGIPQDLEMRGKKIDFSIETSREFKKQSNSLCLRDNMRDRVLPSFKDTMVDIEKAKKRKCRVALLSKEKTKDALDLNENIEEWMCALANFPVVGRQWINCLKSIENEGETDKKTKAIIFWTTARHNMAYVSLYKNLKRFEELNMDPLVVEKKLLEKNEKIIIEFTIKLTEHPQIINDEDIKKLKEFYTNKQIAEIIYLIAVSNMFDRFTEALGFGVTE